MSVGLLQMIDKRHSGDAWVVINELGNGTGANVSRHADAVAIGLWPSRGYEIHGYENKASRGDVIKELNDPTKADAVGKFCDFWWLVVEDLRIIDGLVIPATWGVLYPRHNVLRVHKKAPKRSATPINRGFAAAMIRKVCSSWVPKRVHDEMKKTALDDAVAQVERESKWKRSEDQFELEQLRNLVADFAGMSGVDLGDRNLKSTWRAGDIGRAVKAVLDAKALHYVRHDHLPAEMVRNEIAGLERKVRQHENAAQEGKSAIERVSALLQKMEQEEKETNVGSRE